MSCENKDRKRNRILNFRVSEEELRLIDAKVAVSGQAKGDYFIRMLYGETVVIRAGKYQRSFHFSALREFSRNQFIIS